jgi:hypothetical protein
MADTKISALASGAPALGTDETVVARSGANYKLTVSDITGYLGSPITVANGGTGQSSYTNGQLLIGNTTGNTLTKATLTAGTGITITNGSGSITIAATGGGGGTVTSVGGTGTVNGITLTGTVTSSGNLTLGGALTGVDLTTRVAGRSRLRTAVRVRLQLTYCNLASNVTGTLPIANGGTGSTSTTYCNLTSNVTGTLPVANGGTGITSLGTGCGDLARHAIEREPCGGGDGRDRHRRVGVCDVADSGDAGPRHPDLGQLSTCRLTARTTSAIATSRSQDRTRRRPTRLPTTDVGKFVGVGYVGQHRGAEQHVCGRRCSEHFQQHLGQRTR